MIEFDERGLLIPNTKITATVAEFKHHFVDCFPESLTRQPNFENYIRYSDALKRLLQVNHLRQWINGSFATRIVNPRDIDLVTFIDHSIVKNAGVSLNDFGAKGAYETFGVDAYLVEVFPQQHPAYIFYESDSLYWMDCFDKTRRDSNGRKHRKGFLEIIY